MYLQFHHLPKYPRRARGRHSRRRRRAAPPACENSVGEHGAQAQRGTAKSRIVGVSGERSLTWPFRGSAPVSLHASVARTHRYRRDAKVWDLSVVHGPFPVCRPVPTLTSRFAFFVHRCTRLYRASTRSRRATARATLTPTPGVTARGCGVWAGCITRLRR
jgi:hypothetical protein